MWLILADIRFSCFTHDRDKIACFSFFFGLFSIDIFMHLYQNVLIGKEIFFWFHHRFWLESRSLNRVIQLRESLDSLVKILRAEAVINLYFFPGELVHSCTLEYCTPSFSFFFFFSPFFWSCMAPFVIFLFYSVFLECCIKISMNLSICRSLWTIVIPPLQKASLND